jgi:hypothetical protein
LEDRTGRYTTTINSGLLGPLAKARSLLLPEGIVKTLFTLAAAVALMCAAPTFAADTQSASASKAPASSNSQQDKMKACNDQAGDKKGDERKAFMKTCLSAKPAPPPKAESKMAMCNKQTAGMKSDERAKAQSECMKGS